MSRTNVRTKIAESMRREELAADATLTEKQFLSGKIDVTTTSGSVALTLPSPTGKMEGRECKFFHRGTQNALTIIAPTTYFGASSSTNHDTLTVEIGEFGTVMCVGQTYFASAAAKPA